MSSLFTIDENMLMSAFSIDESKLSMGPLDLSQINIDPSTLPSIDVESIFADLKTDISKEQMEGLSEKIVKGFQTYLLENKRIDPAKMNEYFIAYIQTQEAQTLLQTEITQLLKDTGLLEQFQTALQKQMETMMSQYTTVLMSTLEEQMSLQMGNVANSFQDAFTVDTSVFASAIKMNMNENELSELMMSMMTKEVASYDGNLKNLGYANTTKPSMINIYPKDFENKQEVIHILDAYNTEVEKTDKEKVISYTDFVGTLMSSVTDIINVISYVLIAFVAISLVVSSIMIGVITYISVLERKKEIGILRAIGASKRNISQVFNAETFIIGLLAGLLGIGITLILLIPGNMLIRQIAGNTIGGIIPSKKATQEDPVTALRTE